MVTASTEPSTPNIGFSSLEGWLRPKTIPLLVLLGLSLLLNLSIATAFEVKGEETAGLVVGTEFSLIVLIAVWCTLAPFHFITRYVIGTTLFALAATCMFICAQRDGGGEDTAITITGAMFVQWIIYQMPLWHARWKGWHLSVEQTEAEPTPGKPGSNDFQFGIAQLLLWTTIVAVFLGVTRLLFTLLKDDLRVGSGLGEVNMFLNMALGNSLLVLPLIYACLSRERTWLWLAIAILWAIVVSMAQVLFVYGGGDSFFVLLNLGQFVVVFVTLMLVRFAGIRLFR